MRAEGKTREAERSSRTSSALRHARSVAATAGLYLISSFIPHPSSLSWAAHPFITDDTGTQGKGNWQLELQYEYGRNDATADVGGGSVRQESRSSVFTPVLTYGVIDSLDIALGLNRVSERVTENGAVVEDTSGVGDSTIELKWRFYEANGLSFALKPGMVLPTGDENKGLGNGKTSWGVNFIATYEAKPWAFLGNVAYSHARYKLPQDDAANRSDLWRVSGGIAYSMREELRVVGEAGVRTNQAKDDPFLPGSTGRFAMAGLIYSPTDKVDLDIGYRIGLNDAEPDWTFLVGATLRW